MTEYIRMIEDALTEILADAPGEKSTVLEAMRYSLGVGGKRVRPVLTLEFCALCGGGTEAALPLACGLEMVHTYSLIHDDLPCMDDDDFRRGNPSCHKKFGEATALLAGDGLLTMAFGTLANASLSAERKLKAIALFADKIGISGMIGGQEMDLDNENKTISPERLTSTDEKKTSALLQAACCLGVIAGGGSEEQLQKANEYAYHLGLAFQIVDDILDVNGDEQLLGKPTGSDKENGKYTYVKAYGLEKAREIAADHTKMAIAALDAFPDHEDLSVFTSQLLDRKK